MRIFIGLIEVAGFYRSLKRGLEELGHSVTYQVLEKNSFAYGGETPSRLMDLYRWLWKLPSPRGRLGRLLLPLVKVARLGLCGLLVARAAWRHDLFIFSVGTSFLKNYWDVRLLRWLGKRTLFVYHGSDSRPPYLNGKFTVKQGGLGFEEIRELTQILRENVQEADKYAHALIESPSSGHFHNRPFINFFKIGICSEPLDMDAPAESEQAVERNPEVVRILHAPSDSAVKGTDKIRAAVEELKSRGLPLEYVEIQGQPSSVVARELRKCDFVVDEIYSDVFLAGLGTEAARLGKPTVVAGYAADLWPAVLREEELPPSCYCLPGEVLSAIERMAVDREFREELGRRARQFVEQNWSPAAVARRFLAVATDQYPPDWLVAPEQLTYLHGFGTEESYLKDFLSRYVEHSGPDALGLDHNPGLRERCLKFMEPEHVE